MCSNNIRFVAVFAFVFCLCDDGQLQQAFLNNEQLQRTENQVKQLVHLLQKIHLEIEYDYVVLVRSAAKESTCNRVVDNSIVDVTNGRSLVVFCDVIQQNLMELQHSNNFILLSCTAEYFKQFSISNTRYQYVPHIIWLEVEADVRMHEEMAKLCANIHRNGYFQNVIVTPQSLSEEANYSSCDLMKHLRTVGHQIFENPFLDMQGLAIITEADQLPPRSFLFYDNVGQLKLIGFVANHLTTFAERYNASLVIVPPAKMGETIHYSALVNKTFHGLLDIAAVAAPMMMKTRTEAYSYPMELMEYCYMIPCPHIRPIYTVYFDIIEAKAMCVILIYLVVFGILLSVSHSDNVRHLHVSSVLLNDKILRGLLGQAFVMPRKTSFLMKYILFLVCYSSILVCTSYQAYLQSHLVHPPLENRMESYEDIRRNNFKILIDDEESVYMYAGTLEHNHDIFVKENKFYNFLKLRDSMDERYIYPVSLTRWSVFHERQKLFQRKLFYYSSQLCLNNMVLLSFPLRPGLPYKFQYNQHLLDVRDTGLLDCWLRQNFLNMVRLKLSSFRDLSKEDEYGAQLQLNDLLWIWIVYAACILLSLLVFIWELL